jgi:hypothetical protein
MVSQLYPYALRLQTVHLFNVDMYILTVQPLYHKLSALTISFTGPNGKGTMP